MTAEVHRLTGAGLSIGPVPAIVEVLESLLAQAKTGQIIGFGYFLVRGNDDIVWSWRPGCAQAPFMVAGLNGLHQEMMADWVKDGTVDKTPPVAS